MDLVQMKRDLDALDAQVEAMITELTGARRAYWDALRAHQETLPPVTLVSGWGSMCQARILRRTKATIWAGAPPCDGPGRQFRIRRSGMWTEVSGRGHLEDVPE